MIARRDEIVSLATALFERAHGEAI
jgi:hypothetical protein